LVRDYVFFFFFVEVFEVGDGDVFFIVRIWLLVVFAGGGIAVAFVEGCKINLRKCQNCSG